MSSDHFVPFETAKMLVADDDPILREFAAVHLATPYVDVETAEDGVFALERLKKGGIDIALVDLDMPRMDGFGLIEHIRKDPVLRYLPVVVITGREDMVAVDRAYGVGATSFVVKPINWRVLSHQLAYVLRTSRAENALRTAYNTVVATNDVKAKVIHLAKTEPVAALNAILEAVADIEEHTDDPVVRLSTIRIAESVKNYRARHDKLFGAVSALPEAKLDPTERVS